MQSSVPILLSPSWCIFIAAERVAQCFQYTQLYIVIGPGESLGYNRYFKSDKPSDFENSVLNMKNPFKIQIFPKKAAKKQEILSKA